MQNDAFLGEEKGEGDEKGDEALRVQWGNMFPYSLQHVALLILFLLFFTEIAKCVTRFN